MCVRHSGSYSAGSRHGVSPCDLYPPPPNAPLAIGREECFEEMLTYTQEKNIHVRLKSAMQQPNV
jgi:hypothetical protein